MRPIDHGTVPAIPVGAQMQIDRALCEASLWDIPCWRPDDQRVIDLGDLAVGNWELSTRWASAVRANTSTPLVSRSSR